PGVVDARAVATKSAATKSETTPQAAHETALRDRKDREAALEGRANAIATARLVAFGGVVVLLVAIAFAKLPSWVWLGVAGCVVAFGALVVIHARVHAQKDRATAAV